MKELLVEFFNLILHEDAEFDKQVIKYTKSDDTPGEATVATVRRAGDKHPAWKQYQALLSARKKKKSGTDEKKPSRKKSSKAQQHRQQTKQLSRKQTSPRSKRAGIQPSDKPATTRDVYGRNRSGPLLLGSSDAQKLLDEGYTPPPRDKKEESTTPPGNAGSAFNETMSGEASLILLRYPQTDDATLARILFERTRTTELGRQQTTRTSARGNLTYPPGGEGRPTRLPIPRDITDDRDKALYENCLIAARSGRKKLARTMRAVEAAQEEGFSKIQERRCFGGTQGDLRTAEEALQGAQRCFVHDPDLGIVEVPKEILVEWTRNSGGGENATDTLVLTFDVNGNVIYEGWSDKKTLGDIQANSTLRAEYSQMAEEVMRLVDAGTITGDEATQVLETLRATQQASNDLEDGFADIAFRLADTFLRPTFMREESLKRILSWARQREIVGRSGGEEVSRFVTFRQKVQNAVNGSGKSERDQKIRELHAEGRKKGYTGEKLDWYILNRLAQEKQSPKDGDDEDTPRGFLTTDERKILEKIAAHELKHQRSQTGGSIPKTHSGLEIDDSLRELRAKAIAAQRQTVEDLNRVKITNQNGDRVRLGDHLKSMEIVKLLHLDKIEVPEKPGPNASPEEKERYYHQVLIRNTQLMMEGIPVDPQIIKDCLGVSSVAEFQKKFEVVLASSGAKTARDGNSAEEGVEGSTVYIYTINNEGKRVLVARKSYRSKQGPSGKTGTSILWEDDMQKCFDTKAAEKQR